MQVSGITSYKMNPCQPLRFGKTDSNNEKKNSKVPYEILYLYQNALDEARLQAFLNQEKFNMACSIAAAQAQQYNDLVAATQYTKID